MTLRVQLGLKPFEVLGFGVGHGADAVPVHSPQCVVEHGLSSVLKLGGCEVVSGKERLRFCGRVLQRDAIVELSEDYSDLVASPAIPVIACDASTM